MLLGLLEIGCAAIVGAILLGKRPVNSAIVLLPVGLLPVVGLLAHVLGRQQSLYAMALASAEMNRP